MAALTHELVFSDGSAHRVAGYRLFGVNSLDTVDVGPHFKKVIGVIAFQVSSALANFAVTASFTGTVITLTAVNLANDACYLIVLGGSAAP